MANLIDTSIGIIGAGAIGGAVVDRLLNGVGCKAANISACETNETRREHIAAQFGIRVTADPADVAHSALIVLAVPPLEISSTVAAIRDRLSHKPVIVSFAAAVPLAYLESLFTDTIPVVRVNPNSPSLVGSGFNPVTYGTRLSAAARVLADCLLSALGTSVEVPDEQMNLYTALTAVGPTYFLPVFDALIAAGIDGGLRREAAVAAATETALGTAKLVAERAEQPAELKLYTGLRPLKDEDVRDLVRAAADDAFSRMTGVQQKVTGDS